MKNNEKVRTDYENNRTEIITSIQVLKSQSKCITNTLKESNLEADTKAIYKTPVDETVKLVNEYIKLGTVGKYSIAAKKEFNNKFKEVKKKLDDRIKLLKKIPIFNSCFSTEQ